MTAEEIRSKLNDALVYPNCPRFWEANEFPISSSIGEGHKFMCSGEEIVTVARRNPKTNKRTITATITSYRGTCWNAKHYYCSMRSVINNLSETGHYIAGYLGGYEIPQEFTDIEFELGRRVTKEDIDSDPTRWEFYNVGDLTNAFDSLDDIYELIEFFKENVFLEDEWEWIIDDFT